jgi:hypothetical protein
VLVTTCEFQALAFFDVAESFASPKRPRTA